jgi:hypothetical protein
MSVATTSTTAAAAAAMVQAIKASGVLVRVDPDQFQKLARQQPEPLIVHATGGFFTTNYQYLMPYRGLAFFTKSLDPLTLPPGTELISAKSIWVPG